MDAMIFLSVVIIALTQITKEVFPERVHGVVTILVALAMGIVASLFANVLGLVEISLAEGIVSALGAIGITSTVSKASGRFAS